MFLNNFLNVVIIYVGVWVFIFTLHQYVMSLTFFLIREKKRAKKAIEDVDIKIINRWLKRITFGKKKLSSQSGFFKKTSEAAYYAYLFSSVIFVIFIAGAALFSFFNGNGYAALAAYLSLFITDVLVLGLLNKKIMKTTDIREVFGAFPVIAYPNLVLNAIFQPAWLAGIGLLLILIGFFIPF